jgi:hypothetical protein
VASRITRKLGGDLAFYHNGLDIYRAILRQGAFDHLVIVGHGSPTWVGMPGKRGLHRHLHDGGDVVSVAAVGNLLRHAWCMYVSLATCMSGASPKWYRTKTWGRLVSPWGKAAYSAGGKYSIASKLAKVGDCYVRAHTTSGHTSYNPAIREFGLDDDLGVPLKPNNTSIKEWNNNMRGERAENALLFL